MGLRAKNDIGSEFDIFRKKAQQQEKKNVQQQQDALKRRAAQLGGGVSGALIKQEQLARNESAERLQGANEQIDAAQRGEERRIREIEDARKFQREERLGSQDFSAEQAGLQRKFLRGERLSSQDFASAQSALARRFQTSEREAAQLYGTGEREASQDFQAEQQQKAMDLQKTLADREFQENQKVNYINTFISAANSKIPPETIQALLDELNVKFDGDGQPIIMPTMNATGTPSATEQLAIDQQMVAVQGPGGVVTMMPKSQADAAIAYNPGVYNYYERGA